MFNRRKIRIKAWTHLFAYIVQKKVIGQEQELRHAFLAGFDEEMEELRSDFLFVLNLLLEWAALDQHYYKSRATPVHHHLYELSSLVRLKESSIFQRLKEKKGCPNADFITLTYHDFLAKNSAFQCYQQRLEPPTDKGEKLLLQLVKKSVFGRSLPAKHLAEKNPYWVLNLTLLKRLLLTTIKELGQEEELSFPLFEDKLFIENKKFYERLVKGAIENEEKINAEINKVAEKRWEASRIVLEDRLFILLALVEHKIYPMTPFPILIHEYMEISKSYSSPKSPSFINAIVDRLRKEAN